MKIAKDEYVIINGEKIWCPSYALKAPQITFHGVQQGSRVSVHMTQGMMPGLVLSVWDVIHGVDEKLYPQQNSDMRYHCCVMLDARCHEFDRQSQSVIKCVKL